MEKHIPFLYEQVKPLFRSNNDVQGFAEMFYRTMITDLITKQVWTYTQYPHTSTYTYLLLTKTVQPNLTRESAHRLLESEVSRMRELANEPMNRGRGYTALHICILEESQLRVPIQSSYFPF